MRTLVAAALILVSGCAAGARLDPGCGLVKEAVDAGAWSLHDEGSFTVRLPSTLQRERVQGMDSQVGRWSAGETFVSYDFGWYSDRLESAHYEHNPTFRVCQKGSGALRPRIVAYDSDEGDDRVVAAHWSNVRGESDLTIRIGGPVERVRAEALAIVRSVQLAR